jgi:hypothetical protein
MNYRRKDLPFIRVAAKRIASDAGDIGDRGAGSAGGAYEDDSAVCDFTPSRLGVSDTQKKAASRKRIVLPMHKWADLVGNYASRAFRPEVGCC